MAAAKPKKQKFAVLHPVKHNGTLYKKDSEIELTEAEAAPLLKVNAIAPLEAEDKAE